MDVRLKCEKPGEIVYTVTITMKAEAWEKLRDQLDASKWSTSYPSWQLRREIDDLLGQARKIYWPKEPAVADATGERA